MGSIPAASKSTAIITWAISSSSERRVLGIPIRNNAGSYNSSVQMCTHVNAIHVTAKQIFERFHLVPELGTFGP